MKKQTVIKLCSFEGCRRIHHAKELCKAHYRQVSDGQPLKPLRHRLPVGVDMADLIRAKSVVDPETACWVWSACKDKCGYGDIGRGGRTLSAHRVSYETFVGPIPEGLSLDHLCRNRSCVNPDHLEPVTQAVNLWRAQMQRRFERRALSWA